MLPQLTKHLLGNWGALFPEKKKPSKINYLGTLGSREGGKISFLAFADNDKKPTFIVKILRNLSKTQQFFNERDALIYLNSLDVFFRNSIPKIILCRRINDVWYLVESILEGKEMQVNLAKNKLPDLEEAKVNFGLVKDWLLKFNLLTQKETIISDEFIRDYISKPIKNFQDIFPLKESEREFLEKTLFNIRSNRGKTMSLFFQHGDFCRHNILFSDSKIRLIDWEFSQNDSLPLYDISFFLITYYQQLIESGQMTNRLDSFKRTFFEKNDYSNLVHQLMRDYCQELKIKENLIKLFFATFLLERAIFEYQNLIELSKRGFVPFVEDLEKTNKTYSERIKDQLWINFFRFMVKNESHFIL